MTSPGREEPADRKPAPEAEERDAVQRIGDNEGWEYTPPPVSKE